jgi:hypothetical protein
MLSAGPMIKRAPGGNMIVPVPARRQWDPELLLGVAFICLSGLTSPLMNGFAKLLGESYSSLQISWARAF